MPREIISVSLAEQTMKVCDVFGTTKGVKNYGVQVIDDEGVIALDATVDLSERGLHRLIKFIRRGAAKSGGDPQEGDKNDEHTGD